MKNIKILHLLPELLSLYGEYGNVAIMKKVLEENGYDVTVERWSGGTLSFTDADFVYIGSGTEENLLEAAKGLLSHREEIAASIEGGRLWLVTGNAPALFGSDISWKGQQYPTLNIWPYTTTMDTTKRFLGDVLTGDQWGAPFLGFINTSCIIAGITEPMLHIDLNPKLGNDKESCGDGFCTEDFFATQLIGPVLTKNPHFLAHLYRKITGEELSIDPQSNLAKAYVVSLNELTKRLSN